MHHAVLAAGSPQARAGKQTPTVRHRGSAGLCKACAAAGVAAQAPRMRRRQPVQRDRGGRTRPGLVRPGQAHRAGCCQGPRAPAQPQHHPPGAPPCVQAFKAGLRVFHQGRRVALDMAKGLVLLHSRSIIHLRRSLAVCHTEQACKHVMGAGPLCWTWPRASRTCTAAASPSWCGPL